VRPGGRDLEARPWPADCTGGMGEREDGSVEDAGVLGGTGSDTFISSMFIWLKNSLAAGRKLWISGAGRPGLGKGVNDAGGVSGPVEFEMSR